MKFWFTRVSGDIVEKLIVGWLVLRWVNLPEIGVMLFLKQNSSEKRLNQKKNNILKFEHILQIYWTKGFFFGGRLFYVDKTFDELFIQTPGLGKTTKQKFKDRFELDFFLKFKKTELLLSYQTTNFTPLTKPINIIYSQINSVNNQRNELYRFNIIRLYLIRSYRGRCHALGKPVRGQRTWSNAWSTYNVNTTLRGFISETRRALLESKKEEKINFKVVKKKYTSKIKKKNKIKKKQIIWF
jgi:ribosomal protein S13